MTSPAPTRRVALIAALFLFSLVYSFKPAQAAPGDLDTTFGSGGVVTTPIGNFSDQANAVAIQPDGKVVAAGYSDNGSNYDFAVVRYNSNGSLDTTFNGTGIVTTPIGGGNDYAQAVAIQPDGKIVAAGDSSNGSQFVFALVRYNQNGTLDTTFNGTGIVVTPIGSSDDGANAVAIQPDGKIIAAGHSRNGPNVYFALARYNPNGTLDTSFNGTGKVTTPIGSSFDFAYAVAIQPDGKIIAAGYSSNGSNYDFAVARYNTNGTLDTSFNGTGISTSDFGGSNDRARAVAIQPGGKIIAAGYSNNGSNTDFALVRYNMDGSLNTTFNGTGRVVTPIGGIDDEANAVAIQPDGKIVTAGYSYNGTNWNFALARYNTDGSLDTTFNGTGKVVTPTGSDGDVANAVAIQPDGKIIAAGYSNNGFYADFALVRYQAFTPLNRAANFDADRKTDISLWNPSSGDWYVRSSSNGFITTISGWGNSALGDIPLPGDYDGDGKTDVAVFRPSEGNWYIINYSNGTASLKNWGGVGDIPVPGDYDGDGKTDVAVYRPSEGNWYILNSRDNTMTLKNWGMSTDKLVPADYDGDGRTDIAVYRPSEGNWYIITSKDGFVRIINWGASDDRLVPADYDGDGRVDIAVFRPSEGNWYIRYWTNTVTVQGWGNSTDTPVPADYDGDGKADIAVYRPGDMQWYIEQSTTNTMRQSTLSRDGIPLPAAYLPQ